MALRPHQPTSYEAGGNTHDLDLPGGPTLCIHCRKGLTTYNARLEHHWLGREQTKETKHHATWADLVDAKDAGCGICARVWFPNMTTHVGHEHVLAESARITSYWQAGKSTDSCMRDREFVVSVNHRNKHNPMGRILSTHRFQLQRVQIFNDTKPAREKEKDDPQENADGSTAAIDPMQWLATCDESHSCAKSSLSNKYIPPRLLELHKTHARLVDTRKHAEKLARLRYATLSHCWGSQGVPLCLTTENYTDSQHEIILSNLPLTFRHAVEVSLKLGISWLWIDSLCIVQRGARHAADWDLHVKEMEHIYANGYVNLAASHATNSSQGLYYNRLQAFCNPLTIQIQSETFHLMASTPTEFIVDWKLNTRAWVVQERLLSPRVIHFGQTDVFFECSHGLRSDHRAEHVYDLGDQVWQYNGWTPFDWRALTASHDKEDALARWLRIAEWYSRCSLSYPTDRLPALSGIARVFNDTYLGDTYVAGSFSKDLIEALLWRVDSRAGNRCFGSYIAPSWNWLSINASIRWVEWRQCGLPSARVMASEIVLANPDDVYGGLTDARLHINGWISTVHVNSSMKRNILVGPWSIKRKVHYKDAWCYAEVQFRWDYDDPIDATGSHITLLCLMENAKNGPFGFVNGLVLQAKQPSSSSQDAVCCRVGLFTILVQGERPGGASPVVDCDELIFESSELTLA